MRNIFICSLIACTALLTKVNGQGSSWEQGLPNQVSPKAYEFTKYNDIPVGTYTGVPDISIPVYTIKSAGLDIPIGLSYHANGIKVSEESSNIGLGWTLNAGGSVVQVVNEYDDFGSYNLMERLSPSDYITNSICFNPAAGPLYSAEHGFDLTHNPLPGINNDFLKNLTDSEPDIFIFNFPGYSGQFIFDRLSHTFICLTDPNVKITSDYSYPTSGAPQYFYIRVPEGHKYTFLLKENTLITSDYGWTGSTGGGTGGNAPPRYMIGQHSSRLFQLLLVQTKLGEEIVFDYETSSQVINYPAVSVTDVRNVIDYYGVYAGEVISNAFPYAKTNMNFFGTAQSFSYLKSITADKVKIEFKNSTGRTDMTGALRLDSIYVRNNTNNTNITSKFYFAYDYFNGNVQGNTIDSYLTNMGIVKTANEKSLRLKLLSFSEVGQPGYEFEYSTKTLPAKTSLAYDDWGFYNGDLDSPLMPRSAPNQDFADAAVLQSIVFPTGGRTSYEYEMNEISAVAQSIPQYTVEAGSVYISDNNVSNPYTSSYGSSVHYVTDNAYWLLVTGSANVTISKALSVDGTCSSNPSSELYYPDASWQIRSYSVAAKDLVMQNGWGAITTIVSDDSYLLNVETGKLAVGGPLYKDWGSITTALPPGVYYFNAGLNDACGAQNTVGQNGFAYLAFQYNMKVVDHVTTMKPKGAGLRVKSISALTETGQTMSKKSYVYNDPVLMSHPLYTTVENIQYDYTLPSDLFDDFGTLRVTVTTNSSAPVNAPSTNASGKFVGYSSVEEQNDDFTNHSLSNGKIVYTFQNMPDGDDNTFHFPTTKPTRENGILLSTEYLNATGQPVQKTITTYVDVTLPCLYGERSYWQSTIGSIGGDGVFFDNFYAVGFYPIKRSKTMPQSTINYLYQGDQQISSQEVITYDSTYNQILKRSTVNSEGDVEETFFKYPFDFSTISIPLQMIAENYIAVPLQTDKYVNGILTYSEKTDYKAIDSLTLFGSKKCFDKATISNSFSDSGPYKTMIEYQQYDEDKLLQYRTSDGVTVTTLWGYNKEYVVAKILNATYTEASNLVNLAVLNNPSSDSALRTELNKLRIGLPHSQVTTFTHLPTIGPTSMTDPNGKMELYEFDTVNRLKLVRDNEGKITKTFDYHFAR